MDLVQNLVDEVRWRYISGQIFDIDADTIERVAESIYPHFTDPDYHDFMNPYALDDLVDEALKRLK